MDVALTLEIGLFVVRFLVTLSEDGCLTTQSMHE